MNRRCAAMTADGAYCRANPQRDRPFCFLHDPTRADEAADARRLGGIRRRREGTLGVAYDLRELDTIEGIGRLVDIVVLDTLALDNGIGRGRVLLAAAAMAGRLLELGGFDARLAALEALNRPDPSRRPDPSAEADPLMNHEP
jgi:hypothetical protein